MQLEHLAEGLFILLVLIVIGVAVLTAADKIMALAVRVFPKLGEWLESLPLGH